jgi:hypothetical protein
MKGPGVCLAGAVFGALILAGCNGDSAKRMAPADLAMTDAVHPFYSDGELTLYEVTKPVNLPIRPPTDAERKDLGKRTPPFDHYPWVTKDDVGLQITWTVANMDKYDPKRPDEHHDHDVKILVNPWNEFGRYVPGVAIEGDNAIPNLAGLEQEVHLPEVNGPSGGSSRMQGTFSYDDMDELATDFATAIDIIENVKPTMTNGQVDDPRVGLVNHVFAIENRTGRSPLTDSYVPKVIPALVGFEFGLETTEPANIAVEFVVELEDRAGDRVIDVDKHTVTFQAPARIFTVATGG